MNATPIRSERANMAFQRRSIFNCVLIYEDAAAGKCGEHFYQRLLAAIDPDCPSTRNLWSFFALTIRETRNIAASTAALADLVILAVSGQRELPAKVKEWIELWLWLIDGSHPALVMLFDSANAKSAAIGAYLRSATVGKHLECFQEVASFAASSAVATLPGRANHCQKNCAASSDRPQCPKKSCRRLNEMSSKRA